MHGHTIVKKKRKERKKERKKKDSGILSHHCRAHGKQMSQILPTKIKHILISMNDVFSYTSFEKKITDY